jgi:hypothetical protein
MDKSITQEATDKFPYKFTTLENHPAPHISGFKGRLEDRIKELRENLAEFENWSKQEHPDKPRIFEAWAIKQMALLDIISENTIQRCDRIQDSASDRVTAYDSRFLEIQESLARVGNRFIWVMLLIGMMLLFALFGAFERG